MIIFNLAHHTNFSRIDDLLKRRFLIAELPLRKCNSSHYNGRMNTAIWQKYTLPLRKTLNSVNFPRRQSRLDYNKIEVLEVSESTDRMNKSQFSFFHSYFK